MKVVTTTTFFANIPTKIAQHNHNTKQILEFMRLFDYREIQAILPTDFTTKNPGSIASRILYILYNVSFLLFIDGASMLVAY